MLLITLTPTASAEEKMVFFPKESQVEKVVRFPNLENSPKVVNEQIAVALSSPLNFY